MAEQVIRPTGVLDPVVEVRPTTGQVDDLLGEIRDRAAKNQRVWSPPSPNGWRKTLPTIWLRMMRVYLHSEVVIERIEIIQDLRLGDTTCWWGSTCCRKGLDLPEVSLVAILDADKRFPAG